MSGQSNIDISYEGRNIEDQLSAALHGTIKYVTHLQSSVSWKKLDDIKDNTKRLFFWTSTLISICLGLFLLAHLIRLRQEVTTLVQYQELFRRMWDEDREIEEERIKEQRQEKKLEERRRQARSAARGRAGSELSRRGTPMASPRRDWATEEPYAPASQYYKLSPFGSQVDAALDNAPLQGADRDEWVHRVASMTQGLRRNYYGKQNQEEDEDSQEDIISETF
ncbi:uncharacterized protein F4817DRAFT_117737 [Daldinia loculata]|uniref:uncharacterized protein n=1 Tax=Daldinia loculata TaxID=103429 RepID=UPI0020C352DA|nr:uncharacterized protein F4817DRAFT_117737 [Daldinia loculata]KAI1646854.1 hypothetical protein F4817DRAFT_117737 [Daldinia loculata]